MSTPDRPLPPGPPPIPTCPECGQIVSHRGHLPGCTVGERNAARSQTERTVIDALTKAVRERRNDDEFMTRLRQRIEEDAHILDRLAGGTWPL